MAASTEPIGACPPRGLPKQFGHPRGVLGHLIGHLMAFKNRGMTRLAVNRLDLEPHQHVLEIGFGSGGGLALAAASVSDGGVAGIDVSAAMVAQARRRNRRAVERGGVDLRQGSALDLPWPEASFDRVFEVNSFHHWPEQRRGLAEAYRVLRPGGRLLLCLRMRHPTRTRLVAPGYTTSEVEQIVDQVASAGFQEIDVEIHHAGREVRCLLATR